MTVDWWDALGWLVSGVLGFAGGAISGDIVAKRAFRREQRALQAARIADWAIIPLGTAMAELRNIGDEAGLDVEMQWARASNGQLEEQAVDRIDPLDFRRVRIAPFTDQRHVAISWKRPNGEHRTVQREVPRFRR